jgi:hypothetical protein
MHRTETIREPGKSEQASFSGQCERSRMQDQAKDTLRRTMIGVKKAGGA